MNSVPEWDEFVDRTDARDGVDEAARVVKAVMQDVNFAAVNANAAEEDAMMEALEEAMANWAEVRAKANRFRDEDYSRYKNYSYADLNV